MRWVRLCFLTRSFSFAIALSLCAEFSNARVDPGFTAEELDWIRSHPVVTYVVDAHAHPFEYIENGEYKGLPAEYLKHVARISKLEFRLVPTADWSEAQQAFLDGKAELFPNVSRLRISPQVESKLFITESYFGATTIIVARANEPVVLAAKKLDGKTVAMRRDSIYAHQMAARHPDIKLLLFKTPGEALEALADGSADLGIGPDVAVLPMIRRRYPGQLSISGVYSELPFEIHMGSRSDLPLLNSIITKSLNAMSARETDVINDSWFEQADFGEPTWTSIARYRLSDLALLTSGILLLGWFAYRAHVARREAQASERAAQASELAKTRFLAAMSHEIRTPLNAILGNLELLAHSALDPLQTSRLKTVRASSDGLLAIIGDVLDLSKIEAGQLSLEHIAFDSVDVLERCLIIHAPNAHGKNIELYGDFGAASVQLHGDPVRFAQIVNNLLSNAIKFTTAGKVTLRLAVQVTPSPHIDVAVEDTGIGMSPAQQRSLFEAFSQADSSINRRFGGTGLGLMLSKLIAEAMGGSIAATSELGVGSRFSVTLPIDDGPLNTSSGRTRFDGELVVVVAPKEEWHRFVTPHLTGLGLRIENYHSREQLEDANLGRASALMVFPDHELWDVGGNKGLPEAARCVIDCQFGGPAHPVRDGHVLAVSCYSLSGILIAVSEAVYSQVAHSTPTRQRSDGERVSASSTPRPQLDTLRVLAVEDNVVNQQLLRDQLRLLGCDAHVVDGGVAALDALTDEEWDILLTDLNMPGMSGFDLVAAVQPRWPTLPILAITAHATVEEHRKCEAAGIRRVLTKPLSLEALSAALTPYARKAPSQSEPEHGEGLDLLGGKPVSPELRAIFAESCVTSLATIQRTRQAGDSVGLRAELHSLCGALNIFGHKTLAQSCVSIGEQLRRSESAETAGLLDELEAGLAALSNNKQTAPTSQG